MTEVLELWEHSIVEEDGRMFEEIEPVTTTKITTKRIYARVRDVPRLGGYEPVQPWFDRAKLARDGEATHYRSSMMVSVTKAFEGRKWWPEVSA